MRLESRKIAYTENGYRTATAVEAQQLIQWAVRCHSVSWQHVPLSDYCDLGFYADCLIGDDVGREYGMGIHLHFGKGTTALQSQLSGAFEAFERTSSRFGADTPSRHGSYSELVDSRCRVVDPHSMLLPRPDDVGRSDFYMSTVTTSYDPETELDWVEAWSIHDQEMVLLPVCFVCSIRHADPVNNIACNRPNGLSSGSCLEEAVLGGLFELVERDACCLYAIHSLPMPNVAPSSIDIESVQNFLDRARHAGVEVVVKNITSDLGIPTFCTFIFDQSAGRPRVVSGVGTHLSRDIALLRSVTEACLDRAASRWQMPRLEGLRMDDVPPVLRWEARRYRSKLFGGHGSSTDYVRRSCATQDFCDVPTSHFEDLRSAIKEVLSILKRNGIDRVFVADLTRLDVPTVRVLVPDLELITKVFYRLESAERNRSRRLFSAPKKMGYVEDADFIPLSGLDNDHLL